MRMLARFALLAAFVFAASAPVWAAAKSFDLVLKDKNGNPVAGVSFSLVSGGKKFNAGVTDANGKVSVPLSLGNFSSGQNTQVVARKCRRDDGTTSTEALISPADAQIPPQKDCEDRVAGDFPWPSDEATVVTVNGDLATVTVGTSEVTSAATSAVGTSSTVPFEVEGQFFGGFATPNGHAGGKFGGGVAVVFPAGSKLLIGANLYAVYLAPTTVETITGTGSETGATTATVSLSGTALNLGPTAQIWFTNRLGGAVEGGWFANWSKLAIKIPGCTGPTCSGSSHFQNDNAWTVGAGPVVKLTDRVAVFAIYNRDQVSTGSGSSSSSPRFNAFNDVRIGILFTIVPASK